MALNPPAADGPDDQAKPRSYQSYRKAIAIAAILAFAINLLLALNVTSSAQGSEASAVQVIQVWVPHIYYAILITGVTVALYVWTRASD